MSKKLIIISIIMWGIIAILATGVFISLSLNQSWSFGGILSIPSMFFGDHSEEQEHGALVESHNQIIEKEINNIEVDWVMGGVQILKSQNDSIKVIQHTPENFRNSKKIKVSIEGDKLRLMDMNGRGTGIGINMRSSSTYLELYLPEKLYDCIAIDNTSGKIEATDLKGKHLIVDNTSGSVHISGIFEVANIESTSGSLDFTGLHAKKLLLDNTSGSIHADGIYEDVVVETTSGKIIVASSQMLKDFSSDSTSGSIELRIPDNNGFTLIVDKVSGSVKSDFAMTQEDDVYTYGNGEIKFEAYLTSGSLKINQY